ncbi:MAG TPA: hypothetical protein VFL60_04155 [Gaiellaceae bacterium]|nr:hypothetical protein [Gaiellaceae bacterium]
MRVVTAVVLLGVQQAVPGPLTLSLAVTALAAILGAWAVTTLRG